ncbi:MAG: peptidase C39, bacteriocin processing [Verrucomicrobia bacterium]|nr:MAG: peptidase C39, bacteriocin processing [Verrucomicrobiota bacterium]
MNSTSPAGVSLLVFLFVADATCAQPIPNRTLPKLEPPKTVLEFQVNPTPQELFRARVFEEPLVVVGGEPTPAENAALAVALTSYSRRNSSDDFASLTRFLQQHPQSPWRAALLTDLGLEYYNTAHYSLALDAWAEAWALAKDATEPKGKAIADRAAGELAYMYARLGRMAELDRLLKSVEGRVFTGPATERISGARQGLSNMKDRPEIAFRCGPLALHRIKLSLNPKDGGDAAIYKSASTQKGFSLPQVAELSKQIGLNYQMAFREKGAAFVVPSVVHWKVGHYAAMIRQDGDRFLLQDPTFQNDVWATKEALEAETSGYFVVRPGALPRGWRAVEAKEGGAIWGKGNTCCNDPKPHAPCDPKSPGANSCDQKPNCKGMAVSSVHLMLVSLTLTDEPVGYTPPLGPAVDFTVRYNQRDAFQPSTFTYSNFGPKWTFDWLSYITDNPLSPSADVNYYVMGGGTRTFTGFNPATQTFAYQQLDQTRLTRTSATSYEMISRDGSRKIFSQSDGATGTSRKIFLTQMIDPFGNAVSIVYDANFRVVALTDAIGQVTTIFYENPSDFYKITKVTDPFGRFATFDYDPTGRLIKITDVIGLTSQFVYEGSSDFVNALITPYGTSTFIRGENGNTRWLETVYPDGDRDRVEYNQSTALGIAASVPANQLPSGMNTMNDYLYYRNTYYWSKNAYASTYPDYTQAKIYHWLHTTDLVSTAGILESVKEPLEGRIWYDYAGQTLPHVASNTDRPAHVGRMLDDGTTQLRTFEYDDFGHVTKMIDPVGRAFSYTYASNGIDLLEVRQTRAGNNELLSQMTYNGQHRRLTSKDPAGQTTTYTYNARGDLLTQTNPKGETTTYTYDTNGYLTMVDHALPGTDDSSRFTYDAFGRVHTQTDSDGYTVTIDRDALDRPIKITYPDGSFEQFTYNRLDEVARRDRAGRVTTYEYDSIRQLTSQTDPLGRSILYQWCKCGDAKTLTDPMGRTTTWHHDVQGRVVNKEYADGSKISYLYESTTGRLRQRIDEKLQIKQYSYNRDDTISAISYLNAAVPTSAVRFTYDPNYQRLTSMTDGVGTTSYRYYPVTANATLGANKLAEVSGPLPNEFVTYNYDELGRAVSRAINGVAQTLTFDAIGRITSFSNALGTFGYTYDGSTRRPLSKAFPNDLTTAFHYLDNSGDRLLDRITHSMPGGTVSEFTYGRDVRARQITSWSQLAGTQVPNIYAFTYDAANQLLSATVSSNASVVKTFAYNYDLSGNRVLEQIDGTPQAATYNALNQLTSSGADSNSPAAYEWDAADRLTVISSGSQRTEFSYDGLGHRLGIRDVANGIEINNRWFVWCGERICEERSSGGSVNKRFFDQGMKVETGANAGIYFYTKDHLDSVRELVDAAGAVRARYDYDCYGRRTRSAGDQDSDFGFTGHYFHAPTGSYLTRFREYNPQIGRWLSRDPITHAEHQTMGGNLYQYVYNSPINRVDVYGLEGEERRPVSAAPGGVPVGSMEPVEIDPPPPRPFNPKPRPIPACRGSGPVGSFEPVNLPPPPPLHFDPKPRPVPAYSPDLGPVGSFEPVTLPPPPPLDFDP